MMPGISMPGPATAIRPRRSMILFAVLAIVMVIVSYVIIVLLAGMCVYLPYLLVSRSESGSGQVLLLFLFGIAVAGAMLWSLVPRPDRFSAPGPLLQPADHPRLFRELEQIAGALGERLPSEVYLIGDVNAWVADRGGLMGVGSSGITTAAIRDWGRGSTRPSWPLYAHSKISDRWGHSRGTRSWRSCMPP
jgi:hypothetical protein